MSPRLPSLPAALLLLLVVAFPADGVERMVSPPPFGTGYSPNAFVTGLAWQGDQGFILWADWRAHKFVAYGSRIDASGLLLDPEGIALQPEPSEETTPGGVIWAGDTWIVFWTDGGWLYAQRISREGHLIGGRVRLAESRFSESRLGLRGVGITTNGESILIRSSEGVLLVSLDLDHVQRVDIGTMTIRETGVAGREYLLFGTDVVPNHNRSFVLRVAPSGEVISRKETPFTRGQFAWTGRDYLHAWVTGDTVFGRRLNAEFEQIGELFEIAVGQPHPILWDVAGNEDGSAHVLWTRTAERELVSVTVDERNLMGPLRSLMFNPPTSELRHDTPWGFVILQGATLYSFDEELRPTGSRTLALRSFAPQHNLAAARDGSADLMVFAEATPEPTNIFGGSSRIMIRDRHSEVARPLLETGYSQDVPMVASNGRGALVLWFEKREDRLEVMALPVSLDGHPTVPAASLAGKVGYFPWNTRWTRLTGSNGETPLALAWTGHVYLAVWRGVATLRFARILENGTVLDPGGIAVPDSDRFPHDPVLARVADVTMLVWSDGHQQACAIVCGGTLTRVMALPFAPDGQPKGQPQVIEEVLYSIRPDVAANGSMALIVWERGGQIYGRRMTASGFLMESEPVVIANPPSSHPSVAAHDDGFVIAWQDQLPVIPFHAYEIQARTMSRSGALSDPFIVANRTWQVAGPYAWTTPVGHAAVGYLRLSGETGMSQRIFYNTLVETRGATRTRAAGRR